MQLQPLACRACRLHYIGLQPLAHGLAASATQGCRLRYMSQPTVPRSTALAVRAQRRPPAATARIATTTLTTTATIATATAALAAVARLQGERGVGDGATVGRTRVALEAHGEQLEV